MSSGRIVGIFWAVCFWGLLFPAGAMAVERPKAANLLPENAIFMVSVPDARALAAGFMNTGVGKMLQDPEVRPWLEKVYGKLGEVVDRVKNDIGLSLSDITSLPQGEITFAMMPVQQGEHGPVPDFVFLMEVGEQMPKAKVILEKIKSQASTSREVTLRGVKCTILEKGHDPPVILIEKDGVVALSMNQDTAEAVLAIWAGEKDARSLADNPNFEAVMSRCQGPQGEKPQLLWFFDPAGLIKSSVGQVQDQAQAPMVAMILPMLGLDGLGGMGGTVFLNTAQFDGIVHLHVAMQPPRTGLLKLPAFRPCVTKPEPWVPADVTEYITLNWDAQATLDQWVKFACSFPGNENYAAKMKKEEVIEGLGIVHDELYPSLEGRITIVSWVEKPITPASFQMLAAVKIKENRLEVIQKWMDSQAKKWGGAVQLRTVAGKSFYHSNSPPAPRTPDGAEPPPPSRPCMGVVDGCLMISNQPGIFEKVLTTSADGTKSLGNEILFKLVAGKAERLAGSAKPSMFAYRDTIESVRFLYELINQEKGRKIIFRSLGLSSSERKEIDSFLKSNPLPPFEALEKYLTPCGATIVDDDTGIHYLLFAMKHKEPEGKK